MSAHRQRRSGFTHRLAGRFVSAVVALSTVALACAVSHLIALPTSNIRQASYEFIPTAAIDTSSTAVGIADSDLYAMSPSDVAVTLDTLQALGVNQVRILVPWALVEAYEGEYDWTEVDKVVDAAADRGMAVLATVTSTPYWAGGSLIAANRAPDAVVKDYSDFVGDLATRYGAAANGGDSKISAYEVWNEPNGAIGWFPSPDPAGYTKLLKAAYKAIKAADPSALVVGGVVGAGISAGDLTINPVDFVEDMYKKGAEGYFDALSFHPYQNKMEFSDGDDFPQSPYLQALALRQVMDLNGDTDKLIWSTEYGLPTSVVSESKQAVIHSGFPQHLVDIDRCGADVLLHHTGSRHRIVEFTGHVRPLRNRLGPKESGRGRQGVDCGASRDRSDRSDRSHRPDGSHRSD